MFTQSWKSQSSIWSGSKARPNMVPTWSWHGPKNGNSKEIGIWQCRSSIANFISLAGLQVKLGQTWSQHSPDVVPKNMRSISMGLTPWWLSLENFSALAGQEVKLGQTWSQNGPNNFSALAGLEVKIGQTWSQHGPEMVPKNRHSIEMVPRPCRFSVENICALASLEVQLG